MTAPPEDELHADGARYSYLGANSAQTVLSSSFELSTDSDLPELLALARRHQPLTVEEVQLLTTVYLRVERPVSATQPQLESRG